MLAAGGFAIGIVCAIAVHYVVTDFLHPVSIQEVDRASAVTHVPIDATATAPTTAVDPVELSRTRSRRSVAKVTIPTIGTRAITPSPDTDGRGDTDGHSGDTLKGETPAAALTAPPASQPMTPYYSLRSRRGRLAQRAFRWPRFKRIELRIRGRATGGDRLPY